MPNQSNDHQHCESGVAGKWADVSHLPWYQRLVVWFWRVQYDLAAKRGKWTWKCYRDQGGGVLETPRRMKKEEAMTWLVTHTGGEIEFVDNHNHFLFYRSRKP